MLLTFNHNLVKTSTNLVGIYLGPSNSNSIQ